MQRVCTGPSIRTRQDAEYRLCDKWSWLSCHQTLRLPKIIELDFEKGGAGGLYSSAGYPATCASPPQQANPESQANRGLLSCPRQPRSLQGGAAISSTPGDHWTGASAPIYIAALRAGFWPRRRAGAMAFYLEPGTRLSSRRRVARCNGGWGGSWCHKR